MAIKTPLYGHNSESTAYVIADYPYGFKLRCTMKVWLEYKEGKGFRMVTRTSNPKKPGIWNNQKNPPIHHWAGTFIWTKRDTFIIRELAYTAH